MTELEAELSATEQLARREEATNDDGTVTVEVFDWEKDGDHVSVEFLTPTNNKESETMPFPRAGGDLHSYKFYRLLQSRGLDVRNAELLEGEVVRARVENRGTVSENWVLECEYTPPRRERLSQFVQGNLAIIKEFAIATIWILVMIALVFVVVLLA